MELGNFVFGNSRGKYPIDRENIQPIFERFCELAKIDCYGYVYDSKSPAVKYEVFNDPTNITIKSPTFTIRRYYWGEDENVANLPNFICGGIEICWYKYMLRDAYSNVELTPDIVKEMLNRCLVSLGITDRIV